MTLRPLCLLFLTCALLVGAALPSAASAVGMRGTIANATGEPLPNTSVSVWRPGALVGYETTDAAGVYFVGGLAPGSDYQVSFYRPGFVEEWYDDEPSQDDADLVTVAASANTVGIDASLTEYGRIQGRITDTDGTPVAGVQVKLTGATSGGNYGSATSGSDGRYQVNSGAGTGNLDAAVKVQFVPPAGSPVRGEYYLNKSTAADADPVALAPSQVVSIDAELEPAASITGRVTGPDDRRLGGIEVLILGLTETVTQPDGTYALKGLSAGAYTVLFAPDSDVFGFEWYDDKLAEAAATELVVTDGQTRTGVDAQLDRWPTLSGTVTGPGGEPVPDVLVGVEAADGGDLNTFNASTEADGTYDLAARVRTGSYRVVFVPPSSSGLALQYFDEKPSLVTSTPVRLELNRTVSGIDASLVPEARISGTVTGPTGAPTDDVTVRLYDDMNTAVSGRQPDASGAYSFAGLAAGTYRVGFEPRDLSLAPEWWDNGPTLATSDPLVLSAGDVRSGIDSRLDPAPTGAISGRVTRVGGSAVPLARIQVYNADGEQVTGTTTSSSGTYTVGRLGTGNYRLRFLSPDPDRDYYGDPRPEDAGYLEPEYYDNKQTLGAATQISVTDGQTTTGINAALEPTGTIRGTVTSETSTLRGARVFLIREDGRRAGPFVTSQTGTYRADGLRPGRWKLYFSPPYTAYAGEYWDDKSTLATADFVTVSARSTVSGIDASLSRVAALVTAAPGSWLE